MRPIAALAVVLACAACEPYAGPAVSAASPQPQPVCTSRTVPVAVGGEPRQAVVEACPQPDGSWWITQTTPGLPDQVYVVPAPEPAAFPYYYPSPADYADWDSFPYWGGSPWFFGIAPAVVVVQRFHHFHHGFARGFGRRFGVGHHFSAAHGGVRR